VIYIPYDPIADRRGVIRRLAQQLSQRTHEFFDRTEEALLYFDADGLGLWVGIRSIRARQLFESLHRSVCRNFVPHAYRVNDGVAWMRFGF